MTVLIDSYGWFEYFFGTKKGAKVRRLLESGERVLISQVNLFEVYTKYLKSASDEAEDKKNFLLARCELIDVDRQTTLDASKIKASHGFGLADAIILATARKHKCKIITGDKHFTKFSEAQML
ncbi:MAG: type II toxin-antitoxin system VapC family toxin [Candidatus Micrarchaeia archaeon]